MLISMHILSYLIPQESRFQRVLKAVCSFVLTLFIVYAPFGRKRADTLRSSLSCRPAQERALFPSFPCADRTSSTADAAQVVNDRLLIDRASCETHVAIGTYQDHGFLADSIGAIGLPVFINHSAIRARWQITRACDPIGAHKVTVDIGQLWCGMISEDEQREVRPLEEIRKSYLLVAASTDAEHIGGAIPGADARRVVQIARKSAPAIGQTQLS